MRLYDLVTIIIIITLVVALGQKDKEPSPDDQNCTPKKTVSAPYEAGL